MHFVWEILAEGAAWRKTQSSCHPRSAFGPSFHESPQTAGSQHCHVVSRPYRSFLQNPSTAGSGRPCFWRAHHARGPETWHVSWPLEGAAQPPGRAHCIRSCGLAGSHAQCHQSSTCGHLLHCPRSTWHLQNSAWLSARRLFCRHHFLLLME